MSVSKKAVDRAVTVAASVAAPALTLLVHTDVLSSLVATDYGAIVVAAVAAYHGGSVAQDKLSASTPPADESGLI